MEIDFQLLIDKLKNAIANRAVGVLWVMPESDVVQALFSSNLQTVATEAHLPKGFVFSDFYGSKTQIIPFESSEYYSAKTQQNTVLEADATSIIPIEAEQTVFVNLVQKAVDEIKSGALDKVVVSFAFERSFEAEIEVPLRKLMSASSTAFRYVLLLPEGEIWLGATPELLVSVHESRMSTVALAGTKSIWEDHPIWGEKELEEQAYVTRYITEILEQDVDQIQVSPVYTVQAGTLLHLKTDISGQLKTNEIPPILSLLHPTPAVCGTPRDKAFSFIKENEHYNRSLYSGFLGFWDDAKTSGSFYVNLRCAKIHQQKVHLFVGCGITHLSDAAAEFQEIVNKTATINRFLDVN